MKVSKKLLTHEEEIALITQAQTHRWAKKRKEAVDKLVEHNLRLVMYVAKKYVNNDRSIFNDLIQEGSMGLMKAIDKFEVEKGYRFSTYAHWWIRQAIQLYLSNTGRTIRTPVYVIEQAGKVSKARKELTQDLGRNPSDEEIAKHLDLPVEKVRHFEESTQHMASLEFSIGEDTSLGDIIEDVESVNPDQVLEDKERNGVISKVLSNLTAREEHIIRLRFGIGLNEEHTLDQIAVKMNVTKERIRQIEAQALKKLGKGDNMRALKQFV